MIVVSAKNLTKAYGTDVILDRVSFHINKGERVGIIGVNGAGKTTLLKVLAGELDSDDGEFFISTDIKVGYLKQDGEFDPEKTVDEEVDAIFISFHEMEREMDKLTREIDETKGDERKQIIDRFDDIREKYDRSGGYTYKSERDGILSSMAFGDAYGDKKISTLSGGERTRLALACLLMKKPDILLLDEPTNHLDIDTLKWLEQYLRGYKGTIILVSHDRYFLDKTVTRVFEVENHKLSIYEGNYSFYAAERRVRREADLRAYEKQQKEIARQEDMIRRFKQRGTEKLAKRAASREKQLAAMDRVERPDGDHGKMKLQFKENFRSGGDVLLAENVSKSFGYGAEEVKLFENVNIDIKRGERVCIVGANGIGKTTLLRLLMGDMQANTGRIKIGYNVQFGYYDQGQQLLNTSNTVIEELRDSYALYSDTELRNMLGRFLFRGDSVFMTVDSLSGGEKARLSLLKLMLSGANVLVLDEPTNHLDIESKEVFEESLLEFPGTCIIVSHDRYFLNRIPTRITELTSYGMQNYLGTYDYYVEKRQELQAEAKTTRGVKEVKAGATGNGDNIEMSSAERRKMQKSKEAEERRRERAKTRLEDDIARIEAEIKRLEEALTDEQIMTDHEKLAQISDELSQNREELEEKYEEWLELQE